MSGARRGLDIGGGPAHGSAPGVYSRHAGSRAAPSAARTNAISFPNSLMIVALLGAVALPAQEPRIAPPEEVPAEAPAVEAAPPVIVTARKWEEDVQEVPQSISVLVDALIRDAGITTVREASFLVPNLFMTEFSSRRLSFPTMRGIGSGQGDPAVTTYVGGVPQLTTSSTNLPLFQVERVEFLRGPQGTLYGRNALGGVIHIVPKRPSEAFEAEIGASYGNFRQRELNLAMSGPLVEERLYFSLAGLAAARDGFTENEFTGHDVDHRDELYGRAEVLWTSERWEIRVAIYGERARDGGFVLSDLDELRDHPRRIDQDYEGKADRDIIAPSLTWEYLGDAVELIGISAYQDWDVHETADFDFSPIDGVRRRTKESQQYFNQEIRLSSAEGAGPRIGDHLVLKWLVGTNFFLSDSSRSAANDFRPGGAGILFPPAQVGTATSWGDFDDLGMAVFGQVTGTLAETVDLGIGLRYDYERKQADISQSFVTGGFPVLETSRDLDESYDHFVPRFSLDWRITERVMVYGLVAQGFKAGGFNLSAPAGELAFGPETSWSYELGLKTTWFDDRLRLNAAAFYIDWDDLQLSLFDQMSGGYVANAGESTSRGFELELEAEIFEGIDVFGSVGYTDAEFDEYVDPYGADVSGNDLAYVPETTWSAGVQASGELGEEGRWFARAQVSGVGTFYYDAGNLESESFTVFDFRAGIEQPHWRLEAWMRNALDEDYVPVAFQPSPVDPFLFVGESGAPRTFGVSLTIRF